MRVICTMRLRFVLILSLFFSNIQAQNISKDNTAALWADSVLSTLSKEERIAQLMVVRLSTVEAKTRKVTFFDSLVTELVKKYNVGGVCLFQGSPVQQANAINALQSVAKTPLMVCIDGEWGVGMRMYDSVMSLPHQMMLGAVQDASIVYNYGKLVAQQCKRLGIHVNYAPVVDINNNPNNPVINDRSFGEDKYTVALYGIQYMRGMQDEGVMACAKHFPGHGDVAVDSHYDLPVINKSMASLDSLELYPFKQIFSNGVSSAMIAHLYIPAIDTTKNVATSISPKNIKGLLREKLNYQGITFTDALEMQGVKKYFPNGEASVQSLMAGNDMLCLPDDVPMAIQKISAAIDSGKLSMTEIDAHCRKVLMEKYAYSMQQKTQVNTKNITADVNEGVADMKRIIADNAITLLRKTNNAFFPLTVSKTTKTAYLGIGIADTNYFANAVQSAFKATPYYFGYRSDTAVIDSLIKTIKSNYDKVIIGVHNFSRTPANNFGISKAALRCIDSLQYDSNVVVMMFGNPYAAKNFCGAKNLVVCYEDDRYTQAAAIDKLRGTMPFVGKLPVTVCTDYAYGAGINTEADKISYTNPDEVGLDPVKLSAIDSIANTAIAQGATPGCVVLVAKDGHIAFHKAYGYTDYSKTQAVNKNSIYDLASMTKMLSTTLAVMKLYEKGKLNLNKKLCDYLPEVKGTDKAKIKIKDLLLHQAGLQAFIPFQKYAMLPGGVQNDTILQQYKKEDFTTPVADELFVRNDFKDSIYHKIIASKMQDATKYVYSDFDFIFLAKVVESIVGMPIDEYVRKNFYEPMELKSLSFNPYTKIPLSKIVPSENDTTFRKRVVHGYVNDPTAALCGGVSGHAGLFGNAGDIAVVLQMLLNGGKFDHHTYLKRSTIALFTDYQSKISRRGYGFDKPEKDNATRSEPYPCASASPQTFGHTGFTGTCAWVDPENDLIYIFLSNRTYPNPENKKLLQLNVRPSIQEAIYQSIIK